MSEPQRVLHIVDPLDRRAELFAAAGRGRVNVTQWSWRDALRDATAPPVADTDWVRLDAPSPAQFSHLVDATEVAGLDEVLPQLWDAARKIEDCFGQRAMLLSASSLETLYDKGATHARCRAAGIEVPPSLSDAGFAQPERADDLIDALRTLGWSAVFVKPRFGSSGSGVMALRQLPGRIRAHTTMRFEGGRLRNVLGSHAIDGAEAVALLDALLASTDVHVERWYPKLGVGNSSCDLRVVVIAGEPRHCAVRGASGPITNLQAGGHDVAFEAFEAALPGGRLDAALSQAAAVAAVFPDALHLGVDIAVRSDGGSQAVLEANAFGDLLPRARWQGKTTHEVEIDALVDGTFERWRQHADLRTA